MARASPCSRPLTRHTAGGLFDEPEGYFQQEPQGKEVTVERTAPRPGQPRQLTLRLAAKCVSLPQPARAGVVLISSTPRRHSLWGHEVWNAARFLASAMESGELDVDGACVLELGAGAGLPSLTASLCGARGVVATDYGTASDDALVAALRHNAAALAAQRAACAAAADWRCDVAVAPHVWGADVAPLLALLPPGCAAFHRIVLADLLFNRTSHRQLLATCQARATRHVREYRPCGALTHAHASRAGVSGAWRRGVGGVQPPRPAQSAA